MTDGRQADDSRPLLRDPSRVLEAGERLDAEGFLEAYPPLPAERSEYVQPSAARRGGQPSAVHVGSVVDGYRIVRQIGRGGMGVVYEAEQLALGRTVALKVMPPGMVANVRATDRFRREATSVARLHHPRIVAIHQFNITDGLGYLAMEYVDGLDLAEIIDRLKTAQMHGRRFVRVSGGHLEQDITEWAKGRKLIGSVPGDGSAHDGHVLDLRNYHQMACAYIADAAKALRHAHAHGVIHRDIKPSNLLLAQDGRIKLSDFGLAKSIDVAGSLTESGDFVGSPAYVSPEQAVSRRVRVDERSDLYSLGVTLYELLTLHQPFSGKNVAVILRNIITKDPPLPTRLNPRLPRDLETIVLKAMEKDPDRRYQTAEEFAEDLRRFLNFEPITARPLGPLARGLRLIRRQRMKAGMLALSLALVASVVLLLTGGLGEDAGQTAARLQQAIEQAGRLDSRSAAFLEYATLIADEMSAMDGRVRLRRIEELVADMRLRLERGEYGDLVALLSRLDAITVLGDEAELDRLLPDTIRTLKIDLVRQLRRELSKPGLDAAAQRAWLAALEDLLVDPDWQVCRNAAVALAERADPTSLGALLDALDERRDLIGRKAILGALASFDGGGRGGADLLVRSLTDLTRAAEWPLRYAAFEALVELGPDDLLERTAHLAQDPEPWISLRWAEARRELSGGLEG